VNESVGIDLSGSHVGYLMGCTLDAPLDPTVPEGGCNVASQHQLGPK